MERQGQGGKNNEMPEMQVFETKEWKIAQSWPVSARSRAAIF